jgi:hypothetical protein
MKWP